MNVLHYAFSEKSVQYYLDAPFDEIEKLVPTGKLIVITDEHVLDCHPWLSKYSLIVIPAGEQHKTIGVVDKIISELITLEADRGSFVVGVGGGVVTDISGFAASIYMRGVKFGFVPTTILAQVDASIGGKNGIDTGLYKNLIGTIRQPDFILFDFAMLKTLPKDQWINGFAEIIKHACIKDAGMFELLEAHAIEDFMQDPRLLAELIERNVAIKSAVVEQDEFEKGDRKLLNFGHTLGHAIENMFELPHGHAISIGMAYACKLSETLNDFPHTDTQRIIRLLQQYHLPTDYQADSEKVFAVLKMDKKRVGDSINFILLHSIGEAVIRKIPLDTLEELLA